MLSCMILITSNIESRSIPATLKVLNKTQKYTCVFTADNPYPDGTTGIAYIGVKIIGNGETDVTVSYFSDNNQTYLGQYQELNGDVVPSNTDEACNFALNHFNDKQL